MSADVARKPAGMCKSGEHPRTDANTGTASTGRHFCIPCRHAREKERRERAPKKRAARTGDMVLSVFEIERILSALPCMGCGSTPTRRGVGEDGAPRWLATPITHHAPRCEVGARREIVQGEGEAA